MSTGLEGNTDSIPAETFVLGSTVNYSICQHIMRYFFASKLLVNMRILDVGSGTGYGSELLSRRNHLVIGIDKDISAVKIAKIYQEQRDNLLFIHGNALKLPFRGDSFDAVVCFEVIEHLDNPLKLLEEVKRVLKPGGLMICSTPNIRYSAHPAYHKHEFRKCEFVDIISKYFIIEDLYIQKLNFIFYAKNLAKRHMIRFVSSIFQKLPNVMRKMISKMWKKLKTTTKTQKDIGPKPIVPRVVNEKLLTRCKEHRVIPDKEKKLTDLSYIFIIVARKGW